MDVASAKAALEERGWVLFPSIVDAGRCQAVLAAIEGVWSSLGRPALYSRQDRVVGPSAIVSPVGMAVLDLAARLPEARTLLLPGPVAAVAEAALGPGYRLENLAGVLSDDTRPFFFWHHHLAGLIDAQDYKKLADRYPVFSRIHRLSCTFYPVPLDREHGVMLVHPRRLSDPSHPPFADMEQPWPGQQVIECPPGSVLLLEQSVWHAVTPMRRPGRRAFVAGFLAA